ncbi:AMP-binding protein [Haladaptatus sp. NG-SE-30]
MHDATTSFTLPALFERALRKYADRTAVVEPRPERVSGRASRHLSYADLDARSTALANALVESGVEPEDRVAVLLENRMEYVVVDLAIVKAGAARLPLNPMLSHEEVHHIQTDSGAETVVCDAENAETVATVVDSLSESPEIVLVGGTDGDAPTYSAEFRRYDRLIAESDETAPAVDVSPNDVAGHFYTGGTTGEPKGVLYSQGGLAVNLYAHLAELGFDGDDTGLLVTPLSHSGGTFLWANLLAGATTVVQREYDVERTLAAIENRDVTWTFMVPTMVYRLLDHGVGDYDLSSLDRVIYGAAPMRPDRLREGIDVLGPVFVQFYGQTEVPNLITTMGRHEHAVAIEDGHEERLQSAGQPCLLTDIRIVDPTTGENVPQGEPGEIVVSAPYAFEGYHEQQAETARTLRDGWVYTGDIGRIDEDGFLYLLDRKQDVIISGGMNVYSKEVEDVLGDHPAVQDVVVFGVPDDDWGESVYAVVVANDVDSLTERKLVDHVGERLAAYKKPKTVEFATDLPMTTVGKLDKKAARQRFWTDDDRNVS